MACPPLPPVSDDPDGDEEPLDDAPGAGPVDCAPCAGAVSAGPPVPPVAPFDAAAGPVAAPFDDVVACPGTAVSLILLKPVVLLKPVWPLNVALRDRVEPVPLTDTLENPISFAFSAIVSLLIMPVINPGIPKAVRSTVAE